MQCEVNKKFEFNIEEEGTVMDYVDGAFLFIVKDEMWTDFELDALKKRPLTIDFVYKYDIPIFLVTLEDAIDTSDFVFNVHDNEYPDSLYQHFDKGSGYRLELILLDKDNVVRGMRKVQLSNDASIVVADTLKKQLEAPYREDEFLCNLEGIQNTWEPFEMQPMALVSETFK